MESADEVDHRPIKSSISGGRFDGNYFGVQHAACDSISYKMVLGLHGSPKSETYESKSFFIAYNFYNSSNQVAPTRALTVR